MLKKWAILYGIGLSLGLAGCGSTQPESKEEVIQELIDGFSAEEKVGQLLMADFRQNADGTGMTELSAEAKKAIDAYHIGGVILFAENLDTAEQTKALTAALQKAADVPVFIGIDEEGGLVSRLKKSNIPHETIPAAAEITDAAAAGDTIGRELSELGINVDFAPVADVNTNPENPVIGTRAFSSDPNTAAEKVGQFITAMEQTGVSACAKHFPGHGDTAMDSHKGETYVEHTLERLREVEFVPFKEAIAAEVDFIMAGHIKTPNATTDNRPATLSGEMLGILREELGYEGLIVTDAMNMGAIVEEYGSGESAVLAIQAGADIVLMPAELEEAAEALTTALKNGTLAEERVDESLLRILSLKYDKGMFSE